MNGGSTAARKPVARPSSRVVQVDDTHMESLAEIIRSAWTPQATAEGIRDSRKAAAAVNPHGAGNEVPTFLFLSGDRPVGHLTTIPISLSADGVEHKAHWFKGFWVVPEHRNGPVGFLLLKEALRHLETTLSMVVQPAPRRLFQSLGLIDLGKLPNFVRVLRPTRVLRELDFSSTGPTWAAKAARLTGTPVLAHVLGTAASAAIKGWTLGQPNGRSTSIVPVDQIDAPGADALWERIRRQLKLAPSRDFAHIKARYISKSGVYTAVVLHEGAMAGFAILRRPRESGDARLRGIRMATLSDLVYPPNQPQLGLRLLAGAEKAALELNADALLCSGSHKSVQSLLRRRAYVPIGGNVHFMARPASFALDHLALGDCWLMRADGEADDAL